MLDVALVATRCDQSLSAVPLEPAISVAGDECVMRWSSRSPERYAESFPGQIRIRRGAAPRLATVSSSSSGRARRNGRVEGGEQVLQKRAARGVEVAPARPEQTGVLREARRGHQLALSAERIRRRSRSPVDPEVEQIARPRRRCSASGGLPALDQLFMAEQYARIVEIQRAPAPRVDRRRGGDPVELVGSGRAARTFRARFAVAEGCCGRKDTTIPRRRTDVPASGSSSPAIRRSIVDLPEPFAPTTPTRARGSSAKSSPSSTVLLPNDLRTALSETRAMA